MIEDSVIWQDVQLGPRAELKSSIVANNCCLNTDSFLEDSVLGDNVTVSDGCKLEPGSRIQPGTTIA